MAESNLDICLILRTRYVKTSISFSFLASSASADLHVSYKIKNTGCSTESPASCDYFVQVIYFTPCLNKDLITNYLTRYRRRQFEGYLVGDFTKYTILKYTEVPVY